jgi:uncharacterized protein (TIGR03437 family)
VALISPAFGADFSFSGVFAQDDERRQFTFTLIQPGTVLIRTWSYAGGVNLTGARIEPGGFDPSLSLFDSTGLLLATNRDGGCDKVASDPVTTWCWDAFISTPLPSGTYQLVLTESENTPMGPYLADPFTYDGAGNFTAAAPGINTAAGFWDFSPNRRNNSYALDISRVDSAQVPLELSSGAVVNGASWQVGPAGPNTILSLIYQVLPGAPPFQVLIGGQSAEILDNGRTLNFVVPPTTIPNTSALLQISSGGNLLLAAPLQIADASPALFTVSQTGIGQASVLNQDYSNNGASAPFVPAARGSLITVSGTGFGAANPPGPDGLSWLPVGVSATIGGLPAEVTFAGLVPGYTAGLQQINIRIPDECPVGAAVPIRLQLGGHNTQLGTTIAVE